MQKVINLTNKYIILATPLILYSLISNIYLVISANGGKIINLILALFIYFLMTATFIAGWFKMIKQAVINQNIDEGNALMKEFPQGVGEYFIPATGALLMIFLIFITMMTISYFIGIKFIGNPGVTSDILAQSIKNTESLKLFISSLSQEQLIKINLWNFLILGTISFVYYIIFLFLPTIFFKNKNPFIAFFISLKDLFSKKIIKTTGLFILIFIINAILSLLSAICGKIVIAHFLLTLVNFYFITLVGTGIFYYYYHTFIENKVGQHIDIKL